MKDTRFLRTAATISLTFFRLGSVPPGNDLIGISILIQVDAGTLKETPLHKRRGKVRKTSVSFRAGQYEDLWSYGPNCKTPDSLFPQDRSLGFTCVNRLAVSIPDRASNLLSVPRVSHRVSKILLRHADPIIAKHQQTIRTVEIHLHRISVRIMGILKQFADRRWDARNLLASKHI